MFSTNNALRPSAHSSPSIPDGSPTNNSHNSPHQLILNGLVKWRTQASLPALVIQQRDVASRQIEKFLANPNATHIDLRGMKLQGLPPEMARLRTVLQERSTVNTPAELRLSPEAFNKQSDIEVYSRVLKEHIRVETAQASIDPAQAEHQLRCVTSLVNVTNTMREETLPLFNRLIDTLQSVSNPEDSTLQLIGNYFTVLATKVNKNIAKTTAKSQSVSAWPNVSFQSKTEHNLDHIFYISQRLAILKTELQGAVVTRLSSADNLPKARHRVGQLIDLTAFVEKLFTTLDKLQLKKLELANQIQRLKQSLNALQQRCIASELQGAPHATEGTELAQLLIDQTESLKDAVRDITDIQTRLNELAEQALPDDLQQQLPLIQKIKNWNLECQPTLETLQLHKNIGLIMGRLANPHPSAMLITSLQKTLSEKIAKLPINSEYWDLIEAHPQAPIRELAATRRQQIETREINIDELYPQVKTRHTDLAMLSQKEPAFEAAKQGNLKALHVYLRKGLDPELRNDDQKTLLHIAAEHGHTDLITWLASTQQLTIEATCNKGHTPFLAAALAGQPLGMAALRDVGANVNAQDKSGQYAIHLAIESNKRECINYCIQTLDQLEATDNLQITPLLKATQQSKFDTMQWLVNKGGNINAKSKYGDLAIHHASRMGTLAAVKFCAEIFRQDLEAKSNLSETPLLLAAAGSKLDTMQWLLDQGVRTDAKTKDGDFAIHYATRYGDVNAVKFCIEKLGQSLETKDLSGETPFLIAAQENKLETMRWLMSQGADIEAKSTHGDFAIHHAARYGSLETVKFCVEALKQSLEAKGLVERTPLLAAARGNKLDIIRWLIDQGANINAKSASGDLAIHFAAQSNSSDALKFCVEILNQDLEVRDALGNTPLLSAVEYGSLNTVSWLIEQGAYKKAVNQFGEGIVELARGNKELLEILNLNPVIGTWAWERSLSTELSDEWGYPL